MTIEVCSNPSVSDLQSASQRATDWLCNTAAPLWSKRGRTSSGLFAERMTLAGVPDASYFRTFVQARHVFSMCAAGEMGWEGPWAELVHDTVKTLLDHARRDDGLYVHTLDSEAKPADLRADLYDQAFVLFALGTAGAALKREDWFDAAEDLLDAIEGQWSHPKGGFTEGEIVSASVRRQNPHMHLFEAAQALSNGSGRARFATLAETLATLAAEKLIDPASGALLEYFADDFTPAPGIEGLIAEPGHCFEWAWLFERLAATGWSRGGAISDALVAFARRHGIDDTRGVAINEVLIDGTVQNAQARLWPQTERIKAAVARLRRTEDAAEATELSKAIAGLERYYDVPTPGLWRDKLLENDTWLDELAPGSSFYHITCAYLELHRLTYSNLQIV